ncbi:MAG: hypothetical protein LBT82_04075 [Oscillospiraceae bacterium]|jgi:hypothetical protein|nr:hypothetical protein [Oscillospiraceae bacterium]
MKGMVFVSKLKGKKRRNFFGITGKSQIFYLLSFFLLCGVVFGAICAGDADSKTMKSVNFLFYRNIEKISCQPLLETFVMSLSSSFVFIMLEFLFGFSAWGSLVAPLILTFKGFSIGFSASYLCLYHGLKGAGFYILMLLPSCFLCAFSVLLLAREAIRFSFFIFSQVFPKIRVIPRKDYVVKLYFLRTGFCFILVTIAAFLEALSNFLFGGFFKF